MCEGENNGLMYVKPERNNKDERTRKELIAEEIIGKVDYKMKDGLYTNRYEITKIRMPNAAKIGMLVEASPSKGYRIAYIDRIDGEITITGEDIL